MKITSLDELKAWNKNPTEEKPIMLEWFLDWFFEELISKDDTVAAAEAYNAYVEFAILCEDLTSEEAIERVENNLTHYAGHSITVWLPKWQKLQAMISKCDSLNILKRYILEDLSKLTANEMGKVYKFIRTKIIANIKE